MDVKLIKSRSSKIVMLVNMIVKQDVNRQEKEEICKCIIENAVMIHKNCE